MAEKIQNLALNQKIVNEDGTPTMYFLRLLQDRGIISQGAATDADNALTIAQAAQADVDALELRNINTGTGLAGGGNLTADRTLTLNAGINLLTDVDTATIPPTNGQGLIWDNTSSLWKPGTISGGGSAAKTLITETVTTGSATNVSFTSIPSTYRDLEIRVRGRCTKAANNAQIRLRYNNDTAANYDTVTHDFTFNPGGVIGGALTAAQTSALIGYLAAASATANFSDMLNATVGDYRGTTFQKSGISQNGVRQVASNNNMFNILCSFYWRSTSAINRIDIFPDTGGFVDGTVISLYGHS